jgi:hypothetical protein
MSKCDVAGCENPSVGERIDDVGDMRNLCEEHF